MVPKGGGHSYHFFADIAGVLTLYERVCSTIHDANGIDECMLSTLKNAPEPSFRKIENQEATERPLEMLVLNVTDNCNLRCGYCIFSGLYEDMRVLSAKYMAPTVAITAVDRFLAEAPKNPVISFYGGEPLLNVDLIRDVVDYSRKSRDDIRFAMTTNFTRAEENFDLLVDNRFAVAVSIDGPKEDHDYSCCLRIINLYIARASAAAPSAAPRSSVSPTP